MRTGRGVIALLLVVAPVAAWRLLGKPDLTMILNGALAGLVAITAPCAFVSVPSSLVIGLGAGVLVVLAVLFFDRVTLAQAGVVGMTVSEVRGSGRPATRGAVASLLAGAVLLATASAGAAAGPEEKPKGLVDEINLFSYIEASYVWNMGGTGRDDVNELRLYDFDGGFTFNMAEFAVKKEPSARYPFGFGLVVTAGLDAQKNHAIGIFRDDDDQFPFRNTHKYDLQEAYASYRVPLGRGLTVKAGKFVTVHGYEVIESPSNLNFSRSFLFTFTVPLTHVGALASYPVADWLTVTAGPVVGWDVADDNNDALSWMGQLAFTPLKDLTATLNVITGPEQLDNDDNYRTAFDLVVNYTGIRRLTLGLNVDYGLEEDEASLVASGTRRDTDASWWGWAAYAAYDWTEKLRTAVRLEYFQDSDGVRTLALGGGRKVSLWDVTATVQYRIWRGLLARLEFRHDDADEKVFKVKAPELSPTARTQNTLTLALSYLFF